MKKCLFLISSMVFMLMLSISSSADNAYLIGGGGASGQGTFDNGWLIKSTDDGYIYDAEGLRIYLVSSATGIPVEGKKVVDITNNSVATSDVFNMKKDDATKRKMTKYDYKTNISYIFDSGYSYEPCDAANKIPLIIPWDGYPDSASRIKALKSWLLDADVSAKLCSLVGSDIETVRANNWYLAIEPMAYFRYGGKNFAMTATECAVYDQLVSGWLYNKMCPLTHNNLPLSFFLDRTLFSNAPKPMYKWEGSFTNYASNENIIEYLGIGYINYNSPTGDPGDDDIIPPSAPPVSIKFSIEAEPKEYEVTGTAGVPVSIGKNAIIRVDLKQDEETRKIWRERLKDVSTVDVYMTLKQTPGNRSLTCMTNGAYSGSVLSGAKITLSTSDFINKLLYNKYAFKDSTGSLTINPGETKQFDYTFSMYVKFTEAERYATGGDTITITAYNSENSATGTDYASFFRENNPPEYVSYTSAPSAYSEIKQGTIGNEQFEAMAGTPTTRDLYFGVGGSEFIVDFKAEYVKESTATRTYRVHYDGTECEFKQGDQSKDFTFPTPSGGTGTYNVSSMHSGGTCTVTWTGTTPWTGSGGVSGHTAWVTNTWDDSAYEAAMTTAQSYADTVNGTTYSYTSASDNETRTKTAWGASASGSNPHISGTATQGQPYIAPTPPDENGEGADPGQPFVAGQYTAGQSNNWTITVTWTVPAHTCCGPCCSHNLPALNDSWTQEITYDYFDAVKMSVWRIEQGHLNGLSDITGGTSSVLASVLQGNPSYFYNIADTETSRDGRFRYTLEPGQHDAVVWNLGTRTNKCDKQNETWGTGIKYSTTSYPHQSGYLEDTATDKDKLTTEYAKFKEYREKPVTATVISDFLILQTSSGDQSVLYYQKQSNSVQAQQDYNYVSFSKSAGWNNNSKSAANWSASHINIGSYNGNYANTSNKYNGSGSNNTISTIFDNDPANKVTRTARPTNRLLIAKYNIDIKDTIPNDDYQTGTARVLWELKLNYNPDNITQKYSTSSQSLFGGKYGHVKTAPYSPNHTKINDIVVHNPVSAEYSLVLATDENRDQRTSSASWALQKSSAVSECPGNPAECEHRYLDCKYTGTSSHTAACYTAVTPETLNAHDHSVSCVNMTKMQEAVQLVPETKTFGYTGGIQEFTAPVSGTYTFQTWGASGGGVGGLGGYAKGDYYLNTGQKIYIYVGGKGINGTSSVVGGWNGGGTATSPSSDGNNGSGGGATDIRIGGTELYNRIIVAGGGGGGVAPISQAGHGGGSIGLTGIFSSSIYGNGGTQTEGGSGSQANGSFGRGANGERAGGGGGYYGGGSGQYAGGGGSGYVGGVSGGSMQSGVNSGNGKVVITYTSNKRVGEDWGLVNINEVVSGGSIALTDQWVIKQPSNAVIFNCGGAPYTRHICNSSCSHTSVLICNEPHHSGEHYDVSNTTCWSACKDNGKHANITAGAGVAAGAEMGYFINLDWGFQIYFPTVGDFYQTGANGISSLSTQRGKGYVNNMQTSEWVAKKRVRFGFDVIYCGATTTLNANGSQHGNTANGSDNHKHTASCRLYRAGTWIDLSKDYELFNFYCVGSNGETAASSVLFEVTAINAPNLENDNDLPTNRFRSIAYDAKHGGLKTNYIDIIGRIGNLVMEDTDDYRFANLFKTAIAGNYIVSGVVNDVDTSSKNYVLANNKTDIRGLPLNPSYKQDVYGYLSWLRNKTLSFPLSPDKNNIIALKNEPLRFGYNVLLDVSTLGKDYHTIEVFPFYYYYNLSANTVVPLDVYMLTAEGYEAVNLFDNIDLNNVTSYKYYFNYDDEAERRNISASEKALTQSLSAVIPTGQSYSLGNAQYLIFGEQARTYIGNTSTLGVNQNIGGLISASEFQKSIKRWHFTLGLPSSAVVVDRGAAPTAENIAKYKGNGVVIMTAVIRARSNLYTVEYKNEADSTFRLNGTTYALPSGISNVIAIYNGSGKSSIDDLQINKTH